MICNVEFRETVWKRAKENNPVGTWKGNPVKFLKLWFTYRITAHRSKTKVGIAEPS
jgi:hypothetical protein